MASSALSSPSSLSGSAALSQSLKASFSASSGAVRHRRSTYRDVSLSSTANLFFDGMPHHFLDICSLCKKPLGNNSDIFMYRGDTPFCSEKCREERMEMDERREMKWEVSTRKDKKEKKPKNKKSSSPGSPKIHVRAGAVVVG